MTTRADNANCALCGLQAINEASDAGDDMRERIIDTLANVGHYAESEEIDFGEVCQTAQDHVRNERAEATAGELYDKK